MNQHERPPIRRHAAELVASARGTLRDMSASGARLWLVTPATLEATVIVALVLFHHLPALLGAAGPEVPTHG